MIVDWVVGLFLWWDGCEDVMGNGKWGGVDLLSG